MLGMLQATYGEIGAITLGVVIATVRSLVGTGKVTPYMLSTAKAFVLMSIAICCSVAALGIMYLVFS